MYLGGSNEFNSAIENTTGNALKLRLTFDDGTSIDSISSSAYFGGSNDFDDISVGNTVMSYVELSIFTDKIVTNREFLLECGAELPGGTYEYVPIGYFTIQTPYGDIDGITFSAYDRMHKFEKPYTSNLTYPTNSANVLNELCTMCNIELATPIENPIAITENLKGYTCREVLGYIAGIHGFFACIDRCGKLNLRWYSADAIEKPLRMIWQFNKSQDKYEIEKVELYKDSETTYTSGSGIRALYHSNPYATQQIANSLFEKLGGFAYTPAEIEMLDDIRLDPWDVIEITYHDGVTYYVPAMIIQHDFSGGSTFVQSAGKTETENEYSFNGPMTQYMSRMSADLLLVNKVVATKVDAEYVQAHAITVDKLDAITADIKEAVIGELSADFVTTDRLEAEVADIERLIAGKLSVYELNAEVANLGYVTATQVSASYATIAQLNATNATVKGKLSASEADLKYATIESLEANYADIKLANVSVADIGTLFADVGLITSATIVDGHITGYLDAVEVNANKITAGTLTVDRLVFRGANSIVYELNNITGALQAVQGNTLNGEILTDRSITVDKIVANSITANEIAAGAITASELAANAVTAAKIATNAITADKIQANAITTPKIASGSITADKIDVADLFAQDITISGKFTASASAYVAPGLEEQNKIRQYLFGNVTLTAAEKTYFDIYKDGIVDSRDVLAITRILMGNSQYSDFEGAVKSTVNVQINPSTPEKIITLSAMTPWGVEKKSWLGINGINFPSIRGDAVSGGSIETDAGNNVDTMAETLANLTVERTVHSNTSSYFAESYKYSNGLMIINQRQLVTVTINSTSGALYYGSAAINNYPIGFMALPTVQYSTSPGTINGGIWAMGQASVSNAGTMALIRGAAASGTIWVMVTAIGRWK